MRDGALHQLRLQLIATATRVLQQRKISGSNTALVQYVSRGASLQVVGKLLGHTQAATTMRYAHLQDEVLRAATNLYGGLVNVGKVA
jgi:integrase